MNLKQLCDEVDGLRARGVHPLTEVVITDTRFTLISIRSVTLDRGRIAIEPAYDPEPVGAKAEDDE